MAVVCQSPYSDQLVSYCNLRCQGEHRICGAITSTEPVVLPWAQNLWYHNEHTIRHQEHRICVVTRSTESVMSPGAQNLWGHQEHRICDVIYSTESVMSSGARDLWCQHKRAQNQCRHSEHITCGVFIWKQAFSRESVFLSEAVITESELTNI